MQHPSCFVSYSWDHREHTDWVLRLAEDLIVNSVDVRLDRYQQPGSSLTQFMETAVRESDVVALVCTPQFADKANKRSGGVGYETQVVTGALFEAADTDKFVPLLRNGTSSDAVPSYLKGMQAIDFRLDDDYMAALEQLVRRVWGAPIERPARGRRPSFGEGFRPRRHRRKLPPVLRNPPMEPDPATPAPAVKVTTEPEPSRIITVTAATFEDRVLAANRPVLVDFWAPWCGPCRMLAPVLEEIAAEYAGSLDVARVNTDEEQAVAIRYEVLSIPTMMGFSEGQLKKKIIGAYPKRRLVSELADFLPERDEESTTGPLVALTLHEDRIKLATLRPDGTYSFLDAQDDRHGLLYLPRTARDRSSRPIEEFEALLNDSYSSKEDVKRFLEQNPMLILGGEYRTARSQVFLRRDGRAPLAPDFLLEPIAGELADVLEVEPANHVLSVEIDGVAQLSEVVMEAVGRLRAYRDYFEDERRRIEIEDEHGIRAFRPRMFVVVGRAGQIDAVTRRQLETQFSDVTLRTWDDVLRVAKARLGE